MIKVTNLTRYATVVAGYLAGQEVRCAARQMADSLALPMTTVQKVLGLMLAGELIVSTQGMRGGYQLARPADQITVADVIQAVEGGAALTKCSQGDNVCPRQAHCQVGQGWQQIDQQVNAVFQRWTIADLVGNS